jgi:hypothetical protein
MEKFLSARAQDALGVYKQLDEKERRHIFETFRVQNSNKAAKLDKGIESAMVRALFSGWYAKELWGEPTAQALAQFIEQLDEGNPERAIR